MVPDFLCLSAAAKELDRARSHIDFAGIATTQALLDTWDLPETDPRRCAAHAASRAKTEATLALARLEQAMTDLRGSLTIHTEKQETQA